MATTVRSAGSSSERTPLDMKAASALVSGFKPVPSERMSAEIYALREKQGPVAQSLQNSHQSDLGQLEELLDKGKLEEAKAFSSSSSLPSDKVISLVLLKVEGALMQGRKQFAEDLAETFNPTQEQLASHVIKAAEYTVLIKELIGPAADFLVKFGVTSPTLELFQPKATHYIQECLIDGLNDHAAKALVAFRFTAEQAEALISRLNDSTAAKRD